jgi:hypothetical protein
LIADPQYSAFAESALDSCGHQPLFWVDRFISPGCPTGFVTSLLEVQLDGLVQILLLLLHLLRGFQGGLQRMAADCL